MMRHWLIGFVVLACAAQPMRGADVPCEAAEEALRQSLRDQDFEAYARMLRDDSWFACELQDDLLVLLRPERTRAFDESLDRVGIHLMDTSLQRLVWEQARWSLLSREQMARVSNPGDLAVPESFVSRLTWTWWVGGLSLAVSLIAWLWGRGLMRKANARFERRGEWTTDVAEFGKALEEARTPEQFERGLFWLRFLELNDQMMRLKKEEWTRLSRRERELCLMLLEHWDTPEICDTLQVSSQHLYKLRSKLRAGLNLDSNDQLMPALKAWANWE